MCMCDEAFGRSRPFSFLKDVIDTFFLMFAGDETALEGSTARSFRAVLTQKIKNYSDAGAAAAAAAGSGGSLSASLQSADAAAAALEAEAKMAKMKLVKSELDSLATSAKQNIDKVISRGEAIESLVDRTGHLSTSSDAFRKKSKRLNQRLCWENLKLKLLMACAITVRPWHDGYDRWRRVCARPSLRGAGTRVAHRCMLCCSAFLCSCRCRCAAGRALPRSQRLLWHGHAQVHRMRTVPFALPSPPLPSSHRIPSLPHRCDAAAVPPGLFFLHRFPLLSFRPFARSTFHSATSIAPAFRLLLPAHPRDLCFNCRSFTAFQCSQLFSFSAPRFGPLEPARQVEAGCRRHGGTVQAAAVTCSV